MHIEGQIKDLYVSNADGAIVVGYKGSDLIVDNRSPSKQQRNLDIGTWTCDPLLKVIQSTAKTDLRQSIQAKVIVEIKEWFNININNLVYKEE